MQYTLDKLQRRLEKNSSGVLKSDYVGESQKGISRSRGLGGEVRDLWQGSVGRGQNGSHR